jgi:hypothetical protein
MQLEDFWLLEQDPEAYEIIYDLCLINGWASSFVYQTIVPQCITGAASHVNYRYQSIILFDAPYNSRDKEVVLLGRSFVHGFHAVRNH